MIVYCHNSYILSHIVEIANPQLKKHITVHGFRHTYATLNKGEDMTDVQAVMGHANVSMTRHYTHSTTEGRNRVKIYMNDLGL